MPKDYLLQTVYHMLHNPKIGFVQVRACFAFVPLAL